MRENKAVVYWKYLTDGLADVRIDFGDFGGEGRHFFIGMKMRVMPPPPEEVRTATELMTWKDRVSIFIRGGEIFTHLTYPPNVIVKNYKLCIYEAAPGNLDDYTPFAVPDSFYTKNAVMTYAQYKKQGSEGAALRRTNWPEPTNKE